MAQHNIIAKVATVYLNGYAHSDSSRNLRVKVGPEATVSDVLRLVKSQYGVWPAFGVDSWSNVYAPVEPVSEDYARAMSFRDNS